MESHSYFARLQADLQRERRAIAARSPLDCAKVYLGAICDLAFSRMHLELFSRLSRIVNKRGARLAVAAPRGHAKSTIVSLAFVLWCILFEKEQLVLIVSATKEQAASLLGHVKDQLQRNERLLADFPEVCLPEGAKRRTKPWRINRIRLPNGAMVCAYGVGQSLRGARNDKHRPGLIVADDLENLEDVVVEEQRQKLKAWFSGTLLHAGHPDTNVVVVGTVLHHDALLADLIHPLRGHGWTGLKFQAVERFSDSPELWETWATLYRGQREIEGATGPSAADSFFEANRAAMLRSTKVLWPERESFHNLMIMREREGRASFQSEKQNEPLDPELCVFTAGSIHYWDDEYTDEQRLLDALGRNGHFFGACDPSMGTRTGDFSAIVVLYKDSRTKVNYVLAADVKRRTPEETIQRIVHYAQKYRFSKFAVEANNFQQLMIANLQSMVSSLGIRLDVKPVTSRTNKRSRISSMEPDVSQGNLRFSHRHQLLLDQLLQFPLGLHDDGPDALEMAVSIAEQPIRLVVVSSM